MDKYTEDELDPVLRTLCSHWLTKIESAKKHKQRVFQMHADECLSFYNGPRNWDEIMGGEVGLNQAQDIVDPMFKVSVNKTFEFVTIFGPAIYFDNPVRTVKPRMPVVVPPQFFGADAMLYQSLVQAENQRLQVDGLRSVLQEVEVTSIECSKIRLPKIDKSIRTLNREFATELANSIRVDGLIHPIGVRIDPDNPGQYILVHGRHRLFATMKILGQDTISCTIMDKSFDEYDLATIAENMWRVDPNKKQKLAARKRWMDAYIARNPEPKPGEAGGKARAAQMARERAANGTHEEELAEEPIAATADAEWSDQEEEEETKIVADGGTAGFVRQLMAATGKSKRQAEREAKILKSFTEDQIEALDQMEVTQSDMETLSRIEDLEVRGEAVKLIASGMDPAEAISFATKDSGEILARESSRVRAEEKRAKTEQQPELSDEEWFSAACGEKAALFGDTTRYKADAILFRHLMADRAAFRARVKDVIRDAKDSPHGPFYRLVNRLLAASHPNEWALCGTCGGRGTYLNSECPRCRGNCYEINTEEYL